jgi:hypothetical protein
MNENELKDLVETALESFRRRDRYLLENDLSERCIAARLAFHLQNRLVDLPELSVDVEYNRKGISPKKMAIPDRCAKKQTENGVLVVPDIIVHRRGSEGTNILVLKLKKTTNPSAMTAMFSVCAPSASSFSTPSAASSNVRRGRTTLRTFRWWTGFSVLAEAQSPEFLRGENGQEKPPAIFSSSILETHPRGKGQAASRCPKRPALTAAEGGEPKMWTVWYVKNSVEQG